MTKEKIGLTMIQFSPRDLSAAFNEIENNRSLYSRNARNSFEVNFTKQAWINNMNHVFDQALKSRPP
jgi:hypothetical protein